MLDSQRQIRILTGQAENLKHTVIDFDLGILGRRLRLMFLFLLHK